MFQMYCYIETKITIYPFQIRPIKDRPYLRDLDYKRTKSADMRLIYSYYFNMNKLILFGLFALVAVTLAFPGT